MPLNYKSKQRRQYVPIIKASDISGSDLNCLDCVPLIIIDKTFVDIIELSGT